MTLLSGSSTADVAAGVERCWAVVEDLERWPQWQQGLQSVDVVERDEQGRPVVCDTVADAKITKVRCRVRVSYDEPHHLSFTRLESDDVDEMEGSWELQATGDGGTHAVYNSPSIRGTSGSWPDRWRRRCGRSWSGAAPRNLRVKSLRAADGRRGSLVARALAVATRHVGQHLDHRTGSRGHPRPWQCRHRHPPRRTRGL
jgi:hypothetical protein